MFNKVILIGRTTSDVELKYTPTNVAVAQVTLAVNRSFKNANGDREADFIRLVIWSKTAELFAEWIKKGYLVQVEGELRTRSYDDDHGKRQYVTEVVVQSFNNLEQKTRKKTTQPLQLQILLERLCLILITICLFNNNLGIKIKR